MDTNDAHDANATQPLEAFTPAHAHLLAQLSDTEFWSHAADMAQQVSVATQKRRNADSVDDFLLCELEQGWCLLPLASLHEVIVAPTHFTRLPMSPPWVLGLMAWRNEAIAVIHLTEYLLLPPTLQASVASPRSALETSRIAIVSSENIIFGLYVSSIDTGIATTPANAEGAIGLRERVRDPEVVTDIYQKVMILNIEALVARIAQHIGIPSNHE